MIRKLLIVALLLPGFHAAGAALADAQRVLVERYRAAVGSAEAGQRSLESAFAALTPLREALLRVTSGRTVLETLSEEEFANLRRELPGTRINREEVVFVAPDPDYFARLAAAHGDAADRAFFGALKATYPDSVWPVYVEQQTDYSGCTRFGSMSLVATYRAWTEFQRNHPGRYVAAATSEAEAVLESLANSTCACGDMAGVQAELRGFVKGFPASAARAAVQGRLKAARAGKSNIRTACASG